MGEQRLRSNELPVFLRTDRKDFSDDTGAVTHACNPSTLGCQDEWITWGQEFKTSLVNMRPPIHFLSSASVSTLDRALSRSAADCNKLLQGVCGKRPGGAQGAPGQPSSHLLPPLRLSLCQWLERVSVKQQTDQAKVKCKPCENVELFIKISRREAALGAWFSVSAVQGWVIEWSPVGVRFQKRSFSTAEVISSPGREGCAGALRAGRTWKQIPRMQHGYLALAFGVHSASAG
ncbi:hypothetical protein AAY473_013704, partial [Plecturocebus cupreus]